MSGANYEENFDVLFVTTGTETQASTRYRVLFALPQVENAGISTDVRSLQELTEKYPGPALLQELFVMVELLVLSRRYDVLYIQKLLFPSVYLLPPVYHRLLGVVANDIVYDLDDAMYATAPWIDGTARWRRLQLDSFLKASSLVITGSPELSDYARQFNENTRCLPDGLPREEYDHWRQSPAKTDDKIVIGWIGNPENLWYLEKREDVVRDILDEYENVEFHIITKTEKTLPLEERLGEDVHYREWSLDKELEFLSAVDIGIRPLTDDEWTRAKGGFTSVVQLMGMGIPAIVTPLSLLKEFVVDGESGFHATTETEWREALETLIQDETLRKRMGERAVELVSENDLWADDYARGLIAALREVQMERSR